MPERTHWLNQTRLTVYPKLFFAIFLLAGTAWVVLSQHLVDREGKPLGADFIEFYLASKIALAGHAPDAYSLPVMIHAERALIPASDKTFAWVYPPTFYLLVLPLALLPYLASFAAFILVTLAAYVAAFRQVIAGSGHSTANALWCLAGFSGLWVNFYGGQNAFLTAALAALALHLLPRKPTLAGVLIGLLAIKPQLALLFPVALLAIGAWRALASAAVTAAAFLGLGTAVLGPATLHAFLAATPAARLVVEDGSAPWIKMPTIFVMLRLLHLPLRAAYAGHLLVAIPAALALWFLWRRSQDWRLRSAALMTATFLVSPYAFDYDLAWLAFPIAWLALIALRDGWLPADREVLTLAWLLPFLTAPLAKATTLQVAPFVLAALFWLCLRRIPKPDTVASARATAHRLPYTS